MTISLARLRAEQEARGGHNATVPFDIMATAYRRKRLINSLRAGGCDLHSRILSIAQGAQL